MGSVPVKEELHLKDGGIMSPVQVLMISRDIFQFQTQSSVRPGYEQLG